jgi:selenoprotein W-related protein
LKLEYADVEIQLVPSSGGRFEVTVDGKLVFSKARLGRHAQPGEVLALVKEARSEG